MDNRWPILFRQLYDSLVIRVSQLLKYFSNSTYFSSHVMAIKKTLVMTVATLMGYMYTDPSEHEAHSLAVLVLHLALQYINYDILSFEYLNGFAVQWFLPWKF